MAGSDIGQRYQRFLQMFWDPEPKNDELGYPTIYSLGEQFNARPESKESPNLTALQTHSQAYNGVSQPEINQQPTNLSADNSWPESFLDDFESRHWFTYRNEFPAIPRSENPGSSATLTLAVRLRNIAETGGFTSDTGWGCMIRSGQCIIANALSILRLGRSWRKGQKTDDERELISLFADDPRSPFSIHRFVENGAAHCGKHPGEWFGPSATAQCIEALSLKYERTGLHVYIALEGAQAYEGAIQQLAYSADTFTPVLVLAGIRLGIDRVTPVYREALKGIFTLKQTVGIAGGRPSASHYFVATQGDHFFYLDPHHTRPALPYHESPSQLTEDEVNSTHTRRLRRLHIDRMDPSMLLAFLIKDQEDFDDWKLATRKLPGKAILHIVPGHPPGDTTRERKAALDEVESFDDEDEAFQEVYMEAPPRNDIGYQEETVEK